jgi:thioredoxin reductase (NADPH)
MVDLIVVGAGPAGLSCAIEAKKAGLSVITLEKGSLVDAIRRFPSNLVWFSTPELLEIGDVPFVISTVRPTRVDTVNYYQKVAAFHHLDIKYFDRVLSVQPSSRGFRVGTERGAKYDCVNVVVSTGYFDNPGRLGVPGEDLPNVLHYYEEPFRYYDCDVTVVGGRNSSVEAALDLYRHGARVTMVHRGERLSEGVKYWILPDIENRIKAGQIKALFCSTVVEFHEKAVILRTPSGRQESASDFAFVLIGFRPDTAHLTEWGISLDPETLAPQHDPDTFETNVKGLYVAGSIVAGKNTNKVFVENGRGHGRVIVNSILARRR